MAMVHTFLVALTAQLLLCKLVVDVQASLITIPSRPESEPEPGCISPLSSTEFDYIIVGGGTAGAALAARLSENLLKVALIEAGSYYEKQSLASIPIATVLPVGSDPETESPIDWGFVTENQPGANYRAIHFARGKCLGGSSALNFLLYTRPTKETMSEWARVVGDRSYEFDTVLPFFKESVEFSPPDTRKRFLNATVRYEPDAYDFDGGPLSVSFPNYATPFSTWVRSALESIGIEESDGFSAGKLTGAQYCPMTIRPEDQKRSSSESSFLAAAKPGPVKFTNTLAQKILFDETKKATGVKCKGRIGNEFTLEAKQEVIISAGAFQSPQMLMVSGIGPADILHDLEIDVVVDLPGVGQNMWDHPWVAPTHRVQVETVTKVATNLLYLAGQFLRSLIFDTGPFTSQTADFAGWEKIPEHLREPFSEQTREELAQFPDDWPEIEYLSADGYLGNASNLLTSQPRDGYQYASIMAIMHTPTSRGNVTITSDDTEDLPVINPNWLATETDQQLAIAMLKRTREVFASEAIAPILIGEEYYPGGEIQTDEEILEYIKDNVMTIWHPACTCKMGTANDPMAVVDSKAKVFGVEGLRVVDASAFPVLPPGHPQSAVYMLAEKIAHEIMD